MLSTPDGVVKLIDFGYSEVLHLLYERIMPKGWINLSLFWHAPENILDPEVSDTRGDIWGIGSLAYELVTGIPPFYNEAKGSLAALRKIHQKRGSIS